MAFYETYGSEGDVRPEFWGSDGDFPASTAGKGLSLGYHTASTKYDVDAKV